MPQDKSYTELFNEGVAHLGGASIAKAEECFIGIIERYLKDPEKASDSEKKTVAETFYMLGNMANKAFNYQEALQNFRIARDLGHDKEDISERIAWLLYLLEFLDEAKEACKAIKDSGTAQYILGEIALAKGNFKAARKYLEGIADKPDARLALGAALEGLGDTEEARKVFDELKTGDGSLFAGLLQDAERYTALEYYRLAGHVLKRAEKIAPEDAEIQFELGLRFYNASMRDEAIRAYRASIKKMPSLAAYGELASVYEKSNQVKEAKAFAEFGVKNFPGEPKLVATLANCERRLGQADQALARIDAALAGGVDDLHSKAEMLNVKGRIFDARDQVEKAFMAFQACKDAKRDTEEFRMSHVAFPLEVIEKSMALDLKALPRAKNTKARGWELVFFIGFPRSGTTLVQQILDSHPHVETAEERSILTGPLRLLEKFEDGYPASLASLSPGQIEYLRELYFLEVAQHAKPKKGQVFVDKMPLNMIHIPTIVTLFPEAKIIFGLRHPSAVTLSCLIQNFALNGPMANMMSLDEASRLYAKAMELWVKCVAEMPFKHHYVRYENIVTDLEAEARKLTDFLGLEWSPEVLDYQKSAKAKGIINTASYHQVIQPLYTQSLERWRRYEKYFEPYMERLQPFIDEFGYDIDEFGYGK